MPTQTFWNLPAPKREGLIAIALEEFADNDYAGASVSRIVARAGIAKGSLYQYFADKGDLFLFMVEHAGQQLLERLRGLEPEATGGDFFELLRRQMSASTRAALLLPLHSRLLRRAYVEQHPFREELERRGQAASGGHFRLLIEHGIAAGTLAPDLDPELAGALIGAMLNGVGPLVTARLGLSAEAAALGDPASFDRPEVEQIFDTVIRILKRGLLAEREQA